MIRYDSEYKTLAVFWSWVALVVFTAAILTWGMLSHMLIKDYPRQWDFGQLPDTPGQSIYSTQVPSRRSPVPPQLVPPLEAWPERIGVRNPTEPHALEGYE